METDIASCFESIPHDRLMAAVEERVSDRHLLKLVRALLRAGVMEGGAVRHGVTGTPQGGVVSPLLANVYLHRLDRAWGTRGTGVLVRYADDIVVMCASEQEAVRALEALTALLAELGLEPKLEKTRIVHLEEGGEGFDFLGFHHRWVRAERARHVQFLMRSPSRRAMQHARDGIRELTVRSRLLMSVEQVVAELNRFLRGWAGYFRHGNSARHFRTVEAYASMRLWLFVSKRRRWARRHGGRGVHGFAERLGLLTLDGWVVAPRPNRPWRAQPNAVR